MIDEYHYIVAYDIPSDSRRTRISKILEDYGARRQFSVFEVLLTQEQYEKMRERLLRIIEPTEDAVISFFLCAECSEKRDNISLPPDKPVEEIDPDIMIF